MGNLYKTIPPEIFQDELADQIYNIVRGNQLTNILEIGSSDGRGSTSAIAKGIHDCDEKFHGNIFCLEISKIRCQELYGLPSTIPYNYSSVGLDGYLTKDEVVNFYNLVRTNLNRYPLEMVLEWRREEIDYIKHNSIPLFGIQCIKQHNNIDTFDLVLIDGSTFTAEAELAETLGAEWYVLDDIDGIKNYENNKYLVSSSQYKLYKMNPYLRNGYSIFRRI